ncbi:hypothetical protein FXO37_18087 [Capsicum annuum]|nr:hypothetical protein FXO37_18087 [Capsicum annuum]
MDQRKVVVSTKGGDRYTRGGLSYPPPHFVHPIACQYHSNCCREHPWTGVGRISACGGDGLSGGGGGRVSVDIFSRHDEPEIFAYGGSSRGCAENAGAAGTFYDNVPRSLTVNNHNRSTSTDTLLLDLPQPLLTNVYIRNYARAAVPLLWSRVQVQGQISLLCHGTLSFGLARYAMSEFELLAEELLMSDSVIKKCYLVWEKARALYTNDISRFYDVISRITNVKKQESDMSTYLGQVQAVIEEFDALMPVTVDVEKQKEHRQMLFLVLTLAGLSTDHDVVRDQILASPTIPTIDELFSRLLRLAAPPNHKVISSPAVDFYSCISNHRKTNISACGKSARMRSFRKISIEM